MFRRDSPMMRALSPMDSPILREATLLNLNWGEGRFSMADVLGEPGLAHYTGLVPERGDFGYLLSHAIDVSRAGSLGAITLSVEDGNPAGRLYQRLGFIAAPEAPLEGALILRLDDHTATPLA
ncbi:GNAT family N-acetyltransferase [Propionicicella superfundia]|uniref:GNAT family N-acetyltransferase n=1 Tax=Propionicicella superfundia TaxID=348582 RepID=UPI0004025974|nr:GNAT family N-acetyltransferase [Propionicicella superfundia]